MEGVNREVREKQSVDKWAVKLSTEERKKKSFAKNMRKLKRSSRWPKEVCEEMALDRGEWLSVADETIRLSITQRETSVRWEEE